MGRAVRNNQRLVYIYCLMSLWWRSFPAPHYPVLSETWFHGSGLHPPIFLPCSKFGRDPTPQWLLQWQAGGTACTQRVTVQGWASFLPQELPWHIPMPCVLLPSCQSLSFSECGCRGNAPLTLCVSGHKISFCRLLSTQRSAAIKQGRSEDFSQQRLQVLCVMETSRFAASSSHSHSWSILKAPQTLALHPTGLGMGRKEGTGQDRKNNKLNY